MSDATSHRAAKLAQDAARALFDAEYPDGMEAFGLFTKASVEAFHVDCWANILRPFFEQASDVSEAPAVSEIERVDGWGF